MGSTFLELTNRVLRRLNEVELNQTTFGPARGVHATAKDAVNEAIDEILVFEDRWPFAFQTQAITTVIGQEEYAWPDNFRVVDWDSFFLFRRVDDTFQTIPKKLWPINREEWSSRLKSRDVQSLTTGLQVPELVFSAPNGFGLTPSPNTEYSLEYDAYLNYPRLELHGDTTVIPSQYDHVIEAGALRILYMFMENPEKADRYEIKFNQLVNRMSNTLVDKNQRMTDTRIKY